MLGVAESLSQEGEEGVEEGADRDQCSMVEQMHPSRAVDAREATGHVHVVIWGGERPCAMGLVQSRQDTKECMEQPSEHK